MVKTLTILTILITLSCCIVYADPEWKGIVVHHSASRDVSAEEIDRWHKQRTYIDKNGNIKHWDGIGYNFVIRKDGEIEEGRSLDRVGAHARGRNGSHIGICLTGEDEYTDKQVRALVKLLNLLIHKFPIEKIEVHHEE